MSAPAVLVVDDDLSIRRMLARTLAAEGFAVDAVGDGGSALAAIERRMPDVVVLDVMMPGLDGLAVCRRLRAAGLDVPILLLTARDGVAERVAGLDAGADDYVAKPVAPEELAARLRALLRRGRAPARVLAFDDLVLDVDLRAGTRAGRDLALTAREADLLELLLLHPRAVVTREQAVAAVWGGAAVDERRRPVHRLPATQARPTAAPPHGARRRVRARPMTMHGPRSLRARVATAAAVGDRDRDPVLGGGVLALVGESLRSSVDDGLRARAAEIAALAGHDARAARRAGRAGQRVAAARAAGRGGGRAGPPAAPLARPRRPGAAGGRSRGARRSRPAGRRSPSRSRGGLICASR